MTDEIKYKNKFLRGWMKIVRPIGIVQTYILISIFYFVIVPIWSLGRITDPLRLRLKKDGSSYWEQRRQQGDLSIERFHSIF